MVRWLRWHCPPDTGFEIRALAVWGRARYLSVTESPHNTDFHTWMEKKHFCFFQTAGTGNRTPNSGVKGSGANHYLRAPLVIWVVTSPASTRGWSNVGVMLCQRHRRWPNIIPFQHWINDRTSCVVDPILPASLILYSVAPALAQRLVWSWILSEPFTR